MRTKDMTEKISTACTRLEEHVSLVLSLHRKTDKDFLATHASSNALQVSLNFYVFETEEAQ